MMKIATKRRRAKIIWMPVSVLRVNSRMLVNLGWLCRWLSCWSGERFDVHAGEGFQFGQAFLSLHSRLGDHQADVEQRALRVDQVGEAGGSGGVGLSHAGESLLGTGENGILKNSALALGASHGVKSGHETGGTVGLGLTEHRLRGAEHRS